MIIFLDFDGVLHPRPVDRRGIFCHLPNLEEILREFPYIKIVISSSWREVYPFDVLTEIFSIDIQERILGGTPITRQTEKWPRYAEIMQWVLGNHYDKLWLGLDDAKDEFPVNCNNLIACKPEIGFNDCIASELRTRIVFMEPP